jgi:hypothetical protein
MGLLDKIGTFFGGSGEGLGGKIADIIDQRIPDRDLAAKLKHDMDTLLSQQAHELRRIFAETEKEIIKGQVETNKIEAASDSMLKSGWRPMVGWVCVSALAYQMVFRPLIEWVSTIYMWMPPPSLELDTLLTLLFGILGLGAYRTYEKRHGVA